MKSTSKRFAVLGSLAVLCVAALGLGGCGGGGDIQPGDHGPGAVVPPVVVSPTPVAGAEGFYTGTLTGNSSPAFQLLVLEDGSYWLFPGNYDGDILRIRSMVQGVGMAVTGGFASTGAKVFGDELTPVADGTVSATYETAKSTVAGTLAVAAGSAASAAASGTVGFTGGPVAAGLSYNYKTPAVASEIAGHWFLNMLGDGISMDVSAAGAVTGATNGNCQFTGTMTPRASGHAIFDFKLAYGTTLCNAAAGQTLKGVALYVPLTYGGGKELVVAGVNAARTFGVAGYGTR